MVLLPDLAAVANAFGAPFCGVADAGAQLSLELWQNFMTGNDYYCFACQAACPAGRTVGA